jgi:hypothetical protein
MDPHWESDLDSLSALLENPPEPGSEADLCIDTLWERVMRFCALRSRQARPWHSAGTQASGHLRALPGAGW